MDKVLVALIITLFSTTPMAKAIVVLGDSLSAGYGINTEQGWVALLQQKIHTQNTDYQIFNESISGDTSAGGLARLDHILKKHQPAWLLLELGANDGLRGLPPQQMKQNLLHIIQRSQQTHTQVILLGMRIPPNYGKRYVEMFYNVYLQLADELNIPFIPFMLEDIALNKKLMQADGLHPNALAQPLIVNKIWQHMKPILGL